MKQLLFLSIVSSLLFSEEFSYGPNKLQTIEVSSVNSSKLVIKLLLIKTKLLFLILMVLMLSLLTID